MTQVYTGTITTLGWQHDGLAVLRVDGQQTLLPLPVFERDFLPLGHIDHYPAHEQRVIAELAQLNDRNEKLARFLGGELFSTLPLEEQNDLQDQYAYMLDYQIILERRVARIHKRHEVVASSVAAE